jgi:hypothetical protein
MFKRPKVVPITAAKRVSKESLRKETLPPIRTEMVSAWQFATCSQLPEVTKRKYWRRGRDLPKGAHEREEDPLHAQAQLCRQLQQLATHFPLQHQKYAKEHIADSVRINHCFALPSRAFACSEGACNQMWSLKTQHFTRGL